MIHDNNNPEKDMRNQEEENENLTGQEALNKVQTNPIQSSDVSGSVSQRSTGSNPSDLAGVQDLDRGIARGSRRNR